MFSDNYFDVDIENEFEVSAEKWLGFGFEFMNKTDYHFLLYLRFTVYFEGEMLQIIWLDNIFQQLYS